MIKFFRKIRQDLLSEGKTGKYLKYAIGEIILVVIGILIALQINNWNEGRKLESLELNLLTEVRNGLRFDLEEANRAIEGHKNFIKSQQFAIEWLQSDLPFQDSLATHFLQTFFNYDFITKESPYETLKLVGMEIVKNDSLRDHISNLYDLKYEALRRRNEEQVHVKNHYRELMGQNRFKILDSSGLVGYSPLNVSTLKSDETFLFNLKMMMGALKIYNRVLEELTLEIEQLIRRIDNELEIR